MSDPGKAVLPNITITSSTIVTIGTSLSEEPNSALCFDSSKVSGDKMIYYFLLV